MQYIIKIFGLASAFLAIAAGYFKLRAISSKYEPDGASLPEWEAWEINDIRDGYKFYEWLFTVVPDGTVMTVEGSIIGDEKEVFEKLQEFEVHDDFKVMSQTLWPKQRFIKLGLTKSNKKELLKLFKEPGYGQDFVHTFIYHNKKVLMESSDNLCCVYVSTQIPEPVMNDAAKNELFKYQAWDDEV